MRAREYNSPQRMTSFNRLLAWSIALLLSTPSALALNTWDVSSADLARQIVALTGPGTITLVVMNRSSLASDDVPIIRRALERELRNAGVMVRAKDADSDVRVTLSQNLQGWLWVAEVQEGSETRVAMLPVPGATASGAASSEPPITLRADLLYAQDDPILDVAVLGTGTEQHMIVLDPAHIKAYIAAGGNWQLVQGYDIPHSQPFPRDLRGRIVPSTDHLFDAYLPGIACNATKTGDSWTMTVACSDSDDPWPIGSQKAFYNSTRNFFTGVVVPGFGPKLPPFYSTAELVRISGTAFLFADVNGAVHLLEGGSHKVLTGAHDWGSDIAVVRSECGSGMQVVASAAGAPVADSLRAYEISGHEAVTASAPLNFDGAITAIWTGSDKTSATVVVRKPQESRYEAYSVSLACSH